jgi:hypothetical protein
VLLFLDNLNDSMVSWHCIICNHLNYSTILFNLHGISTSNTFEIDITILVVHVELLIYLLDLDYLEDGILHDCFYFSVMFLHT